MQVNQAMTLKVLAIDPTEMLSHAYSIMKKRNVRHLPVVAEDKLLGIITESDVLRYANFDTGVCRLPNIMVDEIMSKNVITCSPEATIAEVSLKMVDHRINCVPVIKDDHLVGLITATDLLRLLSKIDNQKTPIPFSFELERHEKSEAS